MATGTAVRPGVRPLGAGLGARIDRVRAAGASAAAALSLAGITAGSLLIVILAADRPSFLAPLSRPGFFPAWMAGPLSGLWPGLTRDQSSLIWLSSAVMGAMFVLYLVAYATCARLRARWVIACVLAVHVIFLLAPPLSYTDVFNYVNYGRMGVLHDLNPYATIPLLEPHADPSYALSNWHQLLSPYGPLFTLFTYALVPLGVVTSFWALKLAVGLASLATLALVWRCAELVGRPPAPALALVGLNPLVLVWGLGADHNDALMMFFVVLSVYLLLRSRGRSAGAAAVAAVFIKASAGVLLPILMLAGERRRFVLGASIAALALGAASVAAFGLSLPNVAEQGELVTGIGIPNLVGLALGLGGETPAIQTAASLLVLAAVGAACVWTVRSGDWVSAGAAVLLALLVSLSWQAPWYLLWVLPFAALSRLPAIRAATAVLGAYLLLAFSPAAPMLAADIHLNPQATPLGMQHRARIETLVR